MDKTFITDEHFKQKDQIALKRIYQYMLSSSIGGFITFLLFFASPVPLENLISILINFIFVWVLVSLLVQFGVWVYFESGIDHRLEFVDLINKNLILGNPKIKLKKLTFKKFSKYYTNIDLIDRMKVDENKKLLKQIENDNKEVKELLKRLL